LANDRVGAAAGSVILHPGLASRKGRLDPASLDPGGSIPPDPRGRLSRPPPHVAYWTMTRSVEPRPKVSGAYISSAFGGGTTNVPGVVARAT
jgi:hypothetical protein